MKPFIQINDRKIGADYEPVVIAEIGINHEGSLAVAKEMVDAAYAAGAEIVKHQTHVIEDEMSREATRVIPGNTDVSIYDVMARCALNEEEERELKDYVDSKGMIFISTPFSREAVNRLERMNVVAYKIGSGECNNYPLVDYIAQKGKPIILSTGMNDLTSIRKSVEIFRKYQTPYALLHCTNVYPTPAHLVRLGAMTQMQTEFPDAVIGLSDHTLNNNACLAAVALGASILERHFTDHFDRPGPDIVCSMDPEQLAELIQGSREIAMMRGGEKGAVAEEQATIDFAFATVVALREIKEGEILTEQNIWVKRPGVGEIKAEHYKKLLGTSAKRLIYADEHLKFSDVANLE
nr:N-acetylneuraminate synthase [Paenibacillus xylanexedens]